MWGSGPAGAVLNAFFCAACPRTFEMLVFSDARVGPTEAEMWDSLAWAGWRLVGGRWACSGHAVLALAGKAMEGE